MFDRFIAKLFGTAARNANRFRPQVEGLEAREVPATFYWSGEFTTDGGLAENWRNDFERGPSTVAVRPLSCRVPVPA